MLQLMSPLVAFIYCFQIKLFLFILFIFNFYVHNIATTLTALVIYFSLLGFCFNSASQLGQKLTKDERNLKTLCHVEVSLVFL